MPRYDFSCPNGHKYEPLFSFAQYDELSKDNAGTYIICSNADCQKKAYRIYTNGLFNMNYGPEGRH